MLIPPTCDHLRQATAPHRSGLVVALCCPFVPRHLHAFAFCLSEKGRKYTQRSVIRACRFGIQATGSSHQQSTSSHLSAAVHVPSLSQTLSVFGQLPIIPILTAGRREFLPSGRQFDYLSFETPHHGPPAPTHGGTRSATALALFRVYGFGAVAEGVGS